jgi:protein TonB
MTIPPDPLAAGQSARFSRSSTRRRNRWLVAAVGVSALLHVMTLALVGTVHRVMPEPSQPQGEIELLMVEQKGAQPSASVPPEPAIPAPETKQAEKPQVSAPETPSPPAVASSDMAGSVPVPPAAPAPTKQPTEPVEKPVPKAAEQPSSPPPPAPRPQKALTFNLEGTDSDTNAMVLSGRVLPASPDDHFRNRPPAYPMDAAMRGEEGEVRVAIHVAANGSVSGADVMSSSGSASLDNAAVAAVKRWRFHPALKDGQPVPFDVSFIFNFRRD